jgi:hypothetical protein
MSKARLERRLAAILAANVGRSVFRAWASQSGQIEYDAFPPGPAGQVRGLE